jgi:hypothetical protein
MHTLENIFQELQYVPSQHLETVYQLVHALTTPPAQDAGERAAAVERIMGAAGMLSHWSAEEWADFEAELKRTRTELFNRPLPDFDEADAA